MPGTSAGEWTVGQLATAAGITVRTLHHYDALGLLRPSGRSPAGHRRYVGEDMARLYRILSLRSLGFPLSTIRDLLESGDVPSLRTAADRHLAHVARQLEVYENLRRRLIALVAASGDADEVPSDQLTQALEVMTMTVRLSRIYTRRGDSGETHLGNRSRVRKTDPRIEAYGDVDELNCFIGLAVASGGLSERDITWLARIQNDLYDAGADLSVPAADAEGRSRLRIGADYVTWLEEACDEANAPLEPLNSFVLPGGTSGAALLHVCRTVCRRAERRAVQVKDANPEVIRYLNRLSDLLFIMARRAGVESDRLWNPGEHAAVS
jgi:cob(I)alamin adenosyltransferase